MVTIIDGKKISTDIKNELKEQVEQLKEKTLKYAYVLYRLELIRLRLYMSGIRKRPVNISV